ncbi:hypothetical protein IFM89_008385 [Coptis chinensis]|uniref:Glycosyltransferase n=1 Tax=Coptis chinensis TaxID=261450 RepID=A0A835HBF1_9MAGN|nr:hypothetical protein IFM89_008385 [Coptis chinensis]
MYPWFAMGHLTAFMHLANKLAQRGHKVSFILPPKAESKLSHFNLFPELVTFIPITFPQVDGLPLGAETTSDVPLVQCSLIMTAMDRTKTQIESKLSELRPHFVFFDFTHWLPELTQKLGIKSVHYCIISSVSVAYLLVPVRQQENTQNQLRLMEKPMGFPSNSIKLKKFEASRAQFFKGMEFGSGITFHDRNIQSLKNADALGFRTCREMEGTFCDYVKTQFGGKPVLLTGPILPSQPTDTLEPRWVDWLSKFSPSSVVYVAFGSECTLKMEQFQELLLGLEMTGSPFLVALKVPEGVEKIEDALPYGFEERVKERGIVYGGWIQQQLLLGHPSMGCFVTHCGSGSISESLVSECQIVLLPQYGDQCINARMMGGEMKVGVEVEKREEDGWYTKESVSNAVKLVMDEDSQIGKEVRSHHAKWRAFLLSEGLESSYIENFIKSLQSILG